MTWRTGLLFLGAALLLLASAAIVADAVRGGTVQPTNNTAVGTVNTVAPPPATAARATGTTTSPPATATRATGTITSPVATATRAAPSGPTRTAVLADPQATATRQVAATPTLPTVANGGCAMSLPGGYGVDPVQVGYFPALDRTGFVALDSFATAGQTPAILAQAFASDTLSRILSDYEQTVGADLGDRYRIDYRAASGGKPGHGSTQVRIFGGRGCGVTVFVLDGAPDTLAVTFDLLVRSLGPVPVSHTATP